MLEESQREQDDYILDLEMRISYQWQKWGYNMTFNLCKRVINNGGYDRDDMMMKLDVFFLNNRISQDEYNALVALMDNA